MDSVVQVHDVVLFELQLVDEPLHGNDPLEVLVVPDKLGVLGVAEV